MKKEIEPPNNPREVLVWVDRAGWMMANYEDGIWHLWYGDVGIKIANEDDEVLMWEELPFKGQPFMFVHESDAVLI